jgi:glutamate synthase (NADPH/NADH) small chain
MGKPTGFIEWQRVLPKKKSVAERLGDFKEFYQPSDAAETKRQGGRCMDCGVPFCQQGCPLGNQIPDWNDLVYRDRWLDAHKRLASTNNFPEFTGRLCPAPCEGACVLGINAPAVTIEQIEKEIIERAFAEGWVQAEPVRQRRDQSVAIVGSGPAGLAAAVQLARAGYGVVVYEAAARPGGLLRYGIPDFKMEKWVIDRRLTLMEAEGIEFRCGVAVGVAGKGPTWAELREQHDAVLVAVGARVARDLEVPGRELGGVVMAMDFLTEQNEVVAGERESTGWDVKGKQVVILGGGDTGSDCLGTSLRQGAAKVTQIELMPAPPMTRADDNPWPQWPMIFRTSTSQDEGGERAFAIKTVRIEGENGRIKALHAVRLEGPPGRAPAHPGELREVPGGELVIPVDTLILAMGFTGPDAAPLAEQLGVALDRRGNVAVDADYATNVAGVYAAGDAKRGASLIVWAIAEGREAARSIDAYLRGAESWLPTRGIDQPFGGR